MNLSIKGDLLSRDKVLKKIWQSCEIFRGITMSEMYQNYIFAMFFLKYLSDVQDDAINEAGQKKLDSAKGVVKLPRRFGFSVSDACSFNYVFVNRHSNEIGSIINTALRGIASDNPEALGGIFDHIDFDDKLIRGTPREMNVRLCRLIELFSDIDLRPSKLMDNDFISICSDYLAEKFSENAIKQGGEFHTPPGIAELLSGIVMPKQGDSVYDPSCGSGSLLIHLARHASSNSVSFNGYESRFNVGVLCKLNMILHGINNPNILFGNLTFPQQAMKAMFDQKFDKIVANLVFMLHRSREVAPEPDPSNKNQKWVACRLPRRAEDLPDSVSRIVESLAENGAAAVIVPQGILFRAGPVELQLRERLLKQNIIDAIISLPPRIFSSTAIPTSIIVIKKGRADRDVFVIDASKDCESGKRQNRVGYSDVTRIVKYYNTRETIEGYSALVNAEEIERNGFNLTTSRYIKVSEREQLTDLLVAQKEIELLEGELGVISKKIKSCLKLLRS